MSSWQHHRGRWLSPSASNVISPSCVLSKGLPNLCSPPIPTPLFYPFWQPLPPALYINLEMISVPPLRAGQDKTIPHSAAEYHPSRKSSIRDTKDEMLLQLPFSQKGSPTFSATLSPFTHCLVSSCYVWGIWNIFLCINIHIPPDCSLISCFCLPAVKSNEITTKNLPEWKQTL